MHRLSVEFDEFDDFTNRKVDKEVASLEKRAGVLKGEQFDEWYEGLSLEDQKVVEPWKKETE